MRGKRRSWIGTARAAIAFALVYVMIWGAFPAPALAAIAEGQVGAAYPTEPDQPQSGEDEPDAGSQEGEAAPAELSASLEQSAEDSGAEDGDELFAAYARRLIDESLPGGEGPSLRRRSAGQGLEGPNAAIYEGLKSLAGEIAAGDSNDATYAVALSGVGAESLGPWTAADLGVGSVVEGGSVPGDAFSAALGAIGVDTHAILTALLSDCPYDLYWFDKTAEGAFSFGVSGIALRTVGGEDALDFSDATATIRMRVAEGYHPGGDAPQTQVDTSKVASVKDAIAAAQGIASDPAKEGMTALERLAAYRDAICAEVAYDRDLPDDEPYGDPWQLVWVFDGDPGTDVVCEGYAKAFKYLCDLTWPGEDPDVECLLATGKMTGATGAGNHMWDVVRMDDGRSYLVDVTNCDEGTVGAPDKLFMAYDKDGERGSCADGYAFDMGGGNSVTYAYDNDTRAAFGEGALTLSRKAYGEPETRVADIPQATEGLVYDGSEQAGVEAGEGYALSGHTATDAGDHTATATLAEGYEWADGTTDAKTVEWTIARRPVTVTADDKSKVAGKPDPELTATVEGTLGDDTVSYTLSREAGEEPGKYDIRPAGDAEQGNYSVTYVAGTLKVEAAAGSATISVQEGAVASGAWGTCPWELDAAGALTVYPGTAGTDEPWSDYRQYVTSVRMAEQGGDKVVLPSSCRDLFYGHTATTTMDLSGADTSSVTSMEDMFNNCKSLASLDLSGWDVSSVTNMSHMFSGCDSLASLDLSGWDTSGVRSMTDMFYRCTSLASLDLSGWDTSKVTDMSYMFHGCWSLSSLDLSDWNVSSVKQVDGMFAGCWSLASVGDLSGWNMSSVEQMDFMFCGCYKLASLDLSGWNLTSVGSISHMFEGDTSLASLDLSDWDVSSVRFMDSMFFDFTGIVSLDLSGWDTSSVMDMSYMFSGCTSLASLDISGWNTLNVTGADSMFSRCTSLVSLRTGPEYLIKSADMFPAATSINGLWWSNADHTWYTKDEIVSGRSGKADTYTAAPEPGYKKDVSSLTVTPPSNQSYSGRALTPKPVLRDGSYTLVEGTDYTLSYANNTNAGTATVTVTGRGNYTGTAAATFRIAKAPSTLRATVPQATVSCARGSSVSNVAASGAVGAVTFSNASLDATAVSFSVHPGTGAVAVPKGTPAGTYQVRVRAADAGDANREAGTTVATFLVRVTVPAGWSQEGGAWRYYDASGTMATGWLKVGGSWYYFSSSGAMATGWLKVGGSWYYFSSSGAMATGWLKIGSAWYYFSSSGAMAIGWLKVGGAWYYFSSSGAMQTGWLKVGGAWYYFASSGAMQTGWLKVGSAWYYFSSSGAMAIGWLKVGSAWYYFASSGAMATGWLRVDGAWYYFSSSGAMATGWLKIGNTWYYFSSSGAMLTGRQNIGGTWYRFDSSGAWLGYA